MTTATLPTATDVRTYIEQRIAAARLERVGLLETVWTASTEPVPADTLTRVARLEGDIDTLQAAAALLERDATETREG